MEAERPDKIPFVPQFVVPPTVTANPNPITPQVAIVEFESLDDVQAELIISSEDHRFTVETSGSPARKHHLNVVGFHPGKDYRIRFRLKNVEAKTAEIDQEFSFTSPPLPRGFPPMKITLSDPERMEPGITLFSAIHWLGGIVDEKKGYIIAVDPYGEVVWYYQADAMITDVRRLRNGNIAYLASRFSRQQFTAAYEIDLLGNVVNQWVASALLPKIPEGAIAVNTDSFHDELYELQSWNFLTISTELRPLEKYPSSALRPSPNEPANVVGDVIVEFRRDGSIVNRWNLLDLLDTTRIGYGSLSGYWDTRVYKDVEEGTKDWSHANSVICDETEQWMLVSLAHQDAVVKIHRETNEIAWILGVPTGWRGNWRNYLFRPKGKVDLFYHQHSPKITPHNTILLFDNGNYRAMPYQRITPGEQNHSRVVEYALDEAFMTIKQVWEFKGRFRKDRFYSPEYGDVDWLPGKRNLLITDGARMLDEDDKSTDLVPGTRQWARILEVTHTDPADKVFELVIDEGPESKGGWTIFRSERLPSMNLPAGEQEQDLSQARQANRE